MAWRERRRTLVCVGGVLGTTLAVALATPSCYSPGATTCGQDDEPLAPLRGRVMRSDVRGDAGEVADGGPVSGAFVFVELCNLYSENNDPSKAHPNYLYGTIARDDGTFEVSVPRGVVGLHTLLPGFKYGAKRVPDSTADGVLVKMEPLGPKDLTPILKDLKVTPETARPGEELTFTVTATGAGPTEPLSEEVLIMQPATSRTRAFAPPRRGVIGTGFPSGTWTAKFPAPSQPGRYEFVALATSEHCVNAGDMDRAALEARLRALEARATFGAGDGGAPEDAMAVDASADGSSQGPGESQGEAGVSARDVEERSDILRRLETAGPTSGRPSVFVNVQ